MATAPASSAVLVSRGGIASPVAATAPPGKNPKIWAAAQEFEAMFLNSMFDQMFTGLGEDGPFGGGAGVGAWRGMMVEEWSKSVSAKGGVGLADKVYSEILALQEKRA